MTQEEKQLLLKDLCARLPYGVKIMCYKKKNGPNFKLPLSYTAKECLEESRQLEVCSALDLSRYDEIQGPQKLKYDDIGYIANLDKVWTYWDEIKPYLRPMSSMTKEESLELSKMTNDKFSFYLYTMEHIIVCNSKCYFLNGLHLIDWLNAHHFDYNSLIEKGLALEAPEGMYKEV